MARQGAQTQAKHQREQKKREKRRAKEEKMALRREQKRDGIVGSVVQPGAGYEPPTP
jgi:hypothetical protein